MRHAHSGMRVGLASHFADELVTCASEMMDKGQTVSELKNGMLVVRDDSPEYQENGEHLGFFIHTFEHAGVTFHVGL